MMSLVIPDRTVSYLKMAASPGRPKPNLEVLCAHTIAPWYFLALYRAVGWDYHWYDQINASSENLAKFCAKPSRSLYTLIDKGTPAGFFMLDDEQDNIDLDYFGLTPDTVGVGLGGQLLDYAIATAWEKPIKSMTVETCTLDHPRALALYQSRGFEIYDTQFIQAKEDSHA